MASAQFGLCNTKQLYVLGTSPNIHRCLGELIETSELKDTNIWTVYSGIRIHARKGLKECEVEMESNTMAELKETESNMETKMECQCLDLCSSSSGFKKRDHSGLSDQSVPRMKRLKSPSSSFNSDNGYESDSAQCEETEVLVDVHAIIIDDESKFNNIIAPYIFQFFVLPGVFVIAVHSESFEKGHKECNCFVESEHNVFETLRENIETELKKCKEKHCLDGDCMSINGRHVLKCGDVTLGCKNWKEIDLQNVNKTVDLVVAGLLTPWFSSKAEEIRRDMSRRVSDSFLSDISDLFGYGYKLFFISQDVPSERLSQIELQNKSVKDSVYEMLLEWRTRKGLIASIPTLRSAIAKSTHITVNLHSFDAIVKKHKLK